MFTPSQQMSDHYADPYHRGECDHATHASDRQIGDCQMRYELLVDEGTIAEAWFQSKGCLCCESLASLLSEWIEGRDAVEMVKLSQTDFLNHVNENNVDEAGLSEQACATLPLETLQQAIVSPIEAIDGDLADGTGFGGPSLREEC